MAHNEHAADEVIQELRREYIANEMLAMLRDGVGPSLCGLNANSGRAGLEWARDELALWLGKVEAVLAEQEAHDGQGSGAE